MLSCARGLSLNNKNNFCYCLVKLSIINFTRLKRGFMSIRIKVKQSSKCKNCDGIGYHSIQNATSNPETFPDGSVEYVCNVCDGSGKIWKDKDMPLSSLKRLLK